MESLKVNLNDISYPIYINNDFNQLNYYIEKFGDVNKIIIIVDSNVDIHYSSEFISSIKFNKNKVYKYIIKSGEESKNLNTIYTIYKFLIDINAAKDSLIIALGGGVTGDVAGFVAATYLRGIRYVMIPTTLLSQADSSIGGKVGVNFDNIKNMIGAIYQPKFVYINISLLRTLPKRQINSGMAEVIVHALIKDLELFEYIERNIEKILLLDKDIMNCVLKKSCEIKARIVEKDEKDSGIRKMLNFGHTIGHAIESVYGFNLLHGECVSLGIIGAFNIACELGSVDYKQVERIECLLDKIGLPKRIKNLNSEEIFKIIAFDKKIRDEKITFILPKKIGQVFICNTINKETIINAISKLGV